MKTWLTLAAVALVALAVFPSRSEQSRSKQATRIHSINPISPRKSSIVKEHAGRLGPRSPQKPDQVARLNEIVDRFHEDLGAIYRTFGETKAFYLGADMLLGRVEREIDEFIEPGYRAEALNQVHRFRNPVDHMIEKLP